MYVSKEEYLKRSVARLMDTIKASSSTMKEHWGRNEDMKKLGEHSEIKLKKYFLKADLLRELEPLEEDESNSFTTNANEIHVNVVPEILRILNVPKVNAMIQD